MNFLKKLFSKGNMPGMMGLLSAIPGFDIDTLIPQAEAAAVNWFKDMEQKAGAPLLALASLDDTGEHFILSLYKNLPDEARLELWQELPLTDLKNVIENLKNDAENPTIEPASGIDNTAAIPGTTTEAPSEPTGTIATDTEAIPAGTGQQ